MKTAVKKTIRQMLSAKTANLHEIGKLTPPTDGWIKAVRIALGMPSRFAARKLGITARTFREFEQNEAVGSISLKTLRRAADAMGCDVVYALVPRADSFDALINQQAYRRAEKLVRPVAHSMMMEGQATTATEDRLKELAAEFAATPNGALWEDA